MTPASSSAEIPPFDFPRLWSAVETQFRGSLMGIHAKRHWQQVERHGIALAKANGLSEAQLVVVRLFAVLHDSQRTNDGADLGHGQRATAYLRQLQGEFFTLPPCFLEALKSACASHEFGQTTVDPLVGTCWDADRLDLVRIGALPDPDMMSTPAGKTAARQLQDR
jgi:uncharacterized protein